MTDPNAVAVHNGEFFGLEVEPSDAKLVAVPIGWDVTTSYRAGTARGPEAILEASYQIDLFSPDANEAWRLPLSTQKSTDHWLQKSQALREKTERYIAFLEEGGVLENSPEFQQMVEEANKAGAELNHWLYQLTRDHLKNGRKVITLGGDHSVPQGAIKAYAEAYPELSVLHIDAHADLRVAYEGFEYSHASIMYNVLKESRIERLVQVGIRDCSASEVELIRKNPKIQTFFDWDLKDRAANGESWASTCDQIVSSLTKDVYISFDIDGLNPQLCPNTGTPVPGGLEFWQVQYLFRALKRTGRKLVGCDLVEVAPSPQPEDQWDGNVGARVLFQLATLMWAP